jgi:predicted enzyme related to lactoylglutathione lyase
MDPFKTHGAFSWSELMTTDPAAAATFYRELFGWRIDEANMGTGPYRVVHAGDAAVGGIMGMPPGAPPMPPAWGCYVTVTDVDQTLATCKSLGGKVIVQPMVVPSVGRIAVIQDPQGAMLSVIAYATSG